MENVQTQLDYLHALKSNGKLETSPVEVLSFIEDRHEAKEVVIRFMKETSDILITNVVGIPGNGEELDKLRITFVKPVNTYVPRQFNKQNQDSY